MNGSSGPATALRKLPGSAQGSITSQPRYLLPALLCSTTTGKERPAITPGESFIVQFLVSLGVQGIPFDTAQQTQQSNCHLAEKKTPEEAVQEYMQDIAREWRLSQEVVVAHLEFNNFTASAAAVLGLLFRYHTLPLHRLTPHYMPNDMSSLYKTLSGSSWLSAKSTVQEDKDARDATKEDMAVAVIPLLLQDPNHITYEVAFERRMTMNMTVKQIAGPDGGHTDYWIDTWRNNSKPDLVVHEGNDREGRVVGTCVFGKQWGGIQMTNDGRVGAFSDFAYRAHYGKVARGKFGRYASPLDLVLTNDGTYRRGETTQRTIRLTRTTDGPSSTLWGKIVAQNWIMTDAKGQLLAFWTDAGKCLFTLARGTLTVNSHALQCEDDFVYLLMTVLALKEISRRKMQGMAIAAGAAGGSG
ncbi:hypothetical protein QFC21_003571 [Naganishia friedmannii]|uniref:Uncharacterized protein n=1 Tax=Naganishia friedmannii TaxID=89922 RepID=A0ACC2VN01_9TREE|nr:hypothetical protein QFC21_003571 [Naganishia friedmannii]